MEPLLQRIKESRSAVVVPIIDVIDDKTLEYYNGNGRYFQVVWIMSILKGLFLFIIIIII